MNFFRRSVRRVKAVGRRIRSKWRRSADLVQDVAAFGLRGGRDARVTRQSFVAGIPSSSAVLEIGPFCNPALVGTHVRYFDVLDSDGLAERARKLGKGSDRRPETIHYVSASGDLSVVAETFRAVFSSHCIEHQPDLVRHLQQVSALLQDDGRYFLIIPDKRYCFDHFLPESSIARVLEAHTSARRIHDIQSVIEHRALITHNDAARHWRGDHGAPFGVQDTERCKAALDEYSAANGRYIDVHAWQFTPDSFRLIMDSLWALGLTDLVVERIHPTLRSTLQFFVVLRRRSRDGPTFDAGVLANRS